MDTKVRGAVVLAATLQATCHLLQDIFRVTQLTGDQVLRRITRGLSEIPSGTWDIRISAFETLEGIAVQEEGLMKTQVMA